MKTRGAVLTGVGRPLEIVDLELDPPGPGELLVRVHATGLCHSDLSVIDGSRIRPLPMVLGHEAAGEVVEAGPNAESRRATTSCCRSCPRAAPAAVACPAGRRCANRAPSRTAKARCSAGTAGGRSRTARVRTTTLVCPVSPSTP
ncbi:alcohol dehydrogenase catalytic domain-containing protein [Lentzea indica]|uniref:alcohol dehydrogenase catalytic domain-containing protein n=1 Tax=Lentzea indica TaxID=2604800 RepID=UPI0035E41848